MHFLLDGAEMDMPTEDYWRYATPEGYTGYDGREVWHHIHKNIGFVIINKEDNHWKADFNKSSGLYTMISAQVNRGIEERVDAGEAFTRGMARPRRRI
jgi:hypothetical protein